MIRQRRQPWPNPRDTSTDRARAIARSLLAALEQSEATVVELRRQAGQCGPDPQAARQHRDMADLFGETWLNPRPDLDTEDTVPGRLSTEAAAFLAGRTPPTIRRWLADPAVPVTRGDDGLIDETQLQDYLAHLRAPRKGNAA